MVKYYIARYGEDHKRVMVLDGLDSKSNVYNLKCVKQSSLLLFNERYCKTIKVNETSILAVQNALVRFMLLDSLPWLFEFNSTLNEVKFKMIIADIRNSIRCQNKGSGLYALCKRVYKDINEKDTKLYLKSINFNSMVFWYHNTLKCFMYKKHFAPCIKFYNNNNLEFTQIDPIEYSHLRNRCDWLNSYKDDKYAIYNRDLSIIQLYKPQRGFLF